MKKTIRTIKFWLYPTQCFSEKSVINSKHRVLRSTKIYTVTFSCKNNFHFITTLPAHCSVWIKMIFWEWLYVYYFKSIISYFPLNIWNCVLPSWFEKNWSPLLPWESRRLPRWMSAGRLRLSLFFLLRAWVARPEEGKNDCCRTSRWGINQMKGRKKGAHTIRR